MSFAFRSTWGRRPIRRMRSLRAIEGSGGSTAGQGPRETRDNAGWCGQARKRQHGRIGPGLRQPARWPKHAHPLARGQGLNGKSGRLLPEAATMQCRARSCRWDGRAGPVRRQHARLQHAAQSPHAAGPYVGRPGGLPAGSPPFPPPCSIRPIVRRLPWSPRLSGPGPHHPST